VLFRSELAAAIALRTVAEFLERETHAIAEVRFVLFSEADLASYRAALSSLRPA